MTDGGTPEQRREQEPKQQEQRREQGPERERGREQGPEREPGRKQGPEREPGPDCGSALRARLLGCEVRRRRQDLGLTMSALAGRAGISPSFISEIEQGKKHPSLATLDRLAAALGVGRGALVPPLGAAGLEAANLPERARRARERLGLTQEELAASAGLSPSMISQIEAGASRPSLDTIERLARALCVTPCQLLVEGPDPETLVGSLSPDVRRMLLDPGVQAVLQFVAGLDAAGLRAVIDMIRDFRQQPPPA